MKSLNNKNSFLRTPPSIICISATIVTLFTFINACIRIKNYSSDFDKMRELHPNTHPDSHVPTLLFPILSSIGGCALSSAANFTDYYGKSKALSYTLLGLSVILAFTSYLPGFTKYSTAAPERIIPNHKCIDIVISDKDRKDAQSFEPTIDLNTDKFSFPQRVNNQSPKKSSGYLSGDVTITEADHRYAVLARTGTTPKSATENRGK